ncbi:MAG: 2-amino-4-hydroxy-6-hydroxymethyldihydropteridine diphosphokinase [Candidatus Omnitrophica bacterium]|nr:2-amino-4-hydroxy-6-hydroxymethyldihydropteridine diphosphokinase [Candidatus Omnitrophota bacterium]
MIPVTSYLAIGSNLGDRIINIKKSIRYLKSNQRIKFEKASRLYETPAQGGPINQPKYLNAVVKIKTTLPPLDLLEELKLIELKLKRKNMLRWGARTIDLDILFYGDFVFINDRLSIPHPFLHKRIFVLKPLSDIAPNLVHPLYKKSIKELLRKFSKGDEKVIPFNKG